MLLTIVYHDPGDEAGHMMVDSIAKEASTRLGIPVETATISMVEKGHYKPPSGGMVYALFLTRGGHVETVIEASRMAGSVYLGSIPATLTGEAIAGVLRGCKTAALIYWPAKRFVERQARDLEEIRSTAARLSGASISLRPECGSCSEECVVPLTLMPGRLSRRIQAVAGGRVRAPYLLPLLRSGILEYIEEAARRVRAPGRCV